MFKLSLRYEFSYSGYFLDCPAGIAQPLRARRPQPDLDSHRLSRHRVGHAVFDGVRGELYPFARRLGRFLAESSAVGIDALCKLAVRGHEAPGSRRCELPGAACHRGSHRARTGALCGRIRSLRIQYVLEHCRHCPSPARFRPRADNPVVKAPAPARTRGSSSRPLWLLAGVQNPVKCTRFIRALHFTKRSRFRNKLIALPRRNWLS